MASYTPNYNLKKPADAESYDIADANGNMDLIDSALNTLNGKIASSSTTTGGGQCYLYKFGKVVSLHVVSQTWKNSGTGTQVYRTVSGVDYPISIPSEYRPQTNVEIREALYGQRITIGSDGSVVCGSDISAGSNLRFSGCWVTE